MQHTIKMPVATGQSAQPLVASSIVLRNTAWVAALALSSLVSVASAQAVVRSQSTSGHASFSDPASPSGNQGAAQPRAAAARLPAALQQSVSRYPVTMYASPDCNGCKLGRALLERRGIPFQEYRIASPEEQRAASNLGISTLPHLMIGTQALKGYDSQDWANYLSAAGYPETSVLPANYQAPAVKSVLPDAPATPSSTNAPRQASSAADNSAPSSPGDAPPEGFRF